MLDPLKSVKPLNPIYYIPLLEDLPQVEQLTKKSSKNDFTFLQPLQTSPSNDSYKLDTMFEIYKDAIPNYNYEEFKSIIREQVESDRNDDEAVAYLIDTFGCNLFDFITEIVRNRKNIDYGKTTGGNKSKIF